MRVVRPRGWRDRGDFRPPPIVGEIDRTLSRTLPRIRRDGQLLIDTNVFRNRLRCLGSLLGRSEATVGSRLFSSAAGRPARWKGFEDPWPTTSPALGPGVHIEAVCSRVPFRPGGWCGWSGSSVQAASVEVVPGGDPGRVLSLVARPGARLALSSLSPSLIIHM